MEPFNAIILIKLMHVTFDLLTKGGQHERFLAFPEASHLMLSESVRQGKGYFVEANLDQLELSGFHQLEEEINRSRAKISCLSEEAKFTRGMPCHVK